MRVRPVKKLGLAALALLFVNVAPAGIKTTIEVNTFADENGTNDAACSLREALHVINDKAKVAWGGCKAGGPVGDNIIQLQEGTYLLTLGELPVLSSVTIAGKSTIVTDDDDDVVSDAERNPYTGNAPYRKPPVTIIDAASNSRIFNSLDATGSSMTLKDLALKNGKAVYASSQGNGGAIYAAMSVDLDNVVISDSRAEGMNDSSGSSPVYRGGQGGAIFLSKSGTGIAASNSIFKNNHAEGAGGAVAMVCSENLALASHSLGITTSLIQGNFSQRGAGALELCGDAEIELTVSTLSANQTPTTGYGAITFLQSVSGYGSLDLTNLTAAEHATGPVLALSNLKSVALNNSLFLGNSATDGNCKLASNIDFDNGNFNAIDDSSCNALLIPVTSGGNGNMYPPSGQFSHELNPLALKGGLTPTYLLKPTSSYALNKGATGDACTGSDQRGLSRQNGSRCDIGAVERLEPTPVDDEAENGTDSRVVVVDVLANDSFGEDDDGPNKFADPAITVVTDGGTVTPPGGTARPVCVWHDASDSNEDYRNKLVVDNLGVITPESAPISCSYRVNVVPNGSSTTVTSTATASVKASVTNIAPKAVDDIFVRPLGQGVVNLNILDNDTDADDSDPFTSALNPYPIYITSKPDLGVIEGESGYCPDYDPDSGNDPKICYARGIRYVISNVQSPFTDSFTYAVYDDDGRASTGATVTIKTNAPDPDKGETGGSADLAGLALLALLGLRRARRL